MIEIEAPDGAIVEFPDGTDDATIVAAMRQAYPSRSEQPTQEQSPQNYATGMLDTVSNAMAGNFGAELTGHEAALLGRTPDGGWFDYSLPYQERYDRAVAAESGQNQQFREDNPVSSTVGEVGGVLLSPAAKLGAPVKGAGLLSNMLRAGGAGSLFGAVYGLGEDDTGTLASRTGDAINAAMWGGGIGAAIPVVGRGIQSVAKSRANNKLTKELLNKAPSKDDLFQRGGAMIDDVLSKDAPVSNVALAETTERMITELAEDGFHPALHPKANVALQEAAKLAGSPEISRRNIQTLRKLAGNAAGSVDADERRIGVAIKDYLDDFMEASVSADEAGILRAGRDYWARGSKLSMIDEAVEKATRSPTGFENGIRNEFRSILNNKKKRRGLSKDELAQMEKIVQGTPLGNWLRARGGKTPGGGIATAIARGLGQAGAGATIGHMVGGPVGAAVGMGVPQVVGRAARMGAENITRGNTDLLSGLIAFGGRMPNVSPVQSRRLSQQLLAPPAAVPLIAPQSEKQAAKAF